MSRKPNILWILTDQHNRQIGGFAGNGIVSTENLDRLAEKSVRFANAVCTSPVCTPSRMSMLCSKDAHRCSAWNNHWVIFPEHITWPGHFADHGYSTCLVGKMHFGGKNQMNGFQHRPYGDLRHGLGHQPEPLSMFPGYDGARSAGPTEIPESLIQDVIVSRESLAWLLEHQSMNPEKPWFLCASYGRPHSPFTAPGRYIRKYRGRVPPPEPGPDAKDTLEPFARKTVDDLPEEDIQRGIEGYYACVDFVDDCIGELLAGLEKEGLLENTVIIYTSDHGEMLGACGCWGKQVYYDPSIKVPMFISGSGIQGGRDIEDVFSLTDIFPSACGLAGLPVPEGLDGVDWSAVLKGISRSPARDWAPSAYYRYGVRISYNSESDHAPCCAWRAVCEKEWKYVEVEKGENLLFNTREDPLETRNLAGEPAHAARRAEMKKKMYDNFSWEAVHARLAEDRRRLENFRSGLKPGMPNQYMLPDGRTFDAEKTLYDSRWLRVPPGLKGGIIPQEFG